MEKFTGPFEYNSTRPHLKLAEYGRNVQNMVDFVMSLPSKEERNLYAQAVIDLMGQLNPHLRDVSDFTHKLWDHLFIISDFQLDVDSPYPVPSRESVNSKPERLPYPANRIKFRHYGKTVETMIEKAKAIDDPDRKRQYVHQLANFMKMAYITWNKDSVNDETIKSDLNILSEGQLELEEGAVLSKVDPRSSRGNIRDKASSKSHHQNTGGKKKYNNGKRY
ncbi:MAG TPA: DUF4290 domain-containing protein [Anseongella sp.]